MGTIDKHLLKILQVQQYLAMSLKAAMINWDGRRWLLPATFLSSCRPLRLGFSGGALANPLAKYEGILK
jgi:hypothetical protein